MKEQQPVRIADIAAAAGASLSTVSNVLSGKRQMNTPTGRKILELAKEMGYQRPQRIQQRRRIRMVLCKNSGLVVMDTPFFSELIAGVDEACRKHQYELLITYLQMGQHLSKSMNEVMADQPDAVLLLATEMQEEQLRPFLACKAPLVVLDALFPHLLVNAVGINNVGAGYLAAETLIRSGHRRIGFIGSGFSFQNMRDREAGWREALHAHGLEALPQDVIEVEPTMDGACRDMEKCLKARQEPLPQAFFAANDIIAVGVSRALKAAGHRLPQDVSIIGMDDMPMCQVVHPRLTTLSVPKRQMGALAVERLSQLLEQGETAVVQASVGVQVAWRESVRSQT